MSLPVHVQTPCEEWIFDARDEFAAAGVIDRLLHYPTTVNIRGESYQPKDKKRAGVFSKRSRKPTA